MTQKILLLICGALCTAQLFAQGHPWNNPLYIAWSTDGVTFDPPTVFQDSSGVPSVIRWKGDTLIAAFQWFRLPNPSPTFDRVATKISYDNGQTWSAPRPITVSGMPPNYQRPFDPTLVVFGADSLRVFFSSSATPPVGGLDSTVNTYSAKSADGVNFVFEPAPRIDDLHNRVIDPAVVYFNSAWHYLAPIGAPQQGAYHFVSPNGLIFSPVPNIPSDAFHNWTGNYMVESNAELRFYGGGAQYVWYNSSPNGGMWNGYVSTNVMGNDPSVLKVANGSYCMVYVGAPYPNGVPGVANQAHPIHISPNPISGPLHLTMPEQLDATPFILLDQLGQTVMVGILDAPQTTLDLGHLPIGTYFLKAEGLNAQPIFMIK